jgi:hypothetical protein
MNRKFAIAFGAMAVAVLGLFPGANRRPAVGRVVCPEEARQLVGGACPQPTGANCGDGTLPCGTATGCLPGGATQCELHNDACNDNCHIWGCKNGSCSS